MGSALEPPDSTFSATKRLPEIVSYLNTALHTAIVIITLSIAVLCFDNTLFAWHPVFMSVGYLLFMAQGLVSAVMFRHLDGPERVRAIWSHAMLQLRAVTCITIGFGAIYANKVRLGKSHFHSTHAKFGLAALILTAFMPLGGLVSFRRLGIIQKFPEKLQPTIKAMHRRVGVVTWLLALVTIELALPHKAVNKGVITTIWQLGVASIGCLMLLLLNKAVVKAKATDDPLSKAV